MKILLTLILCLYSSCSLFADQSSRPNIIFIMTNDQGYDDLACHGHPFLKTPNPNNYRDKLFAVRSEQWRLVGPDSLFDIQNDLGEETNVCEQHPEVIKDLQKSYFEFWKKARPLMVNEDASLDVEKPFEAHYLKQKAAGGIPDWVAPKL